MDKETELLNMLSKPKVRLRVFKHSGISIVDRKSEWNNRYKKLNIYESKGLLEGYVKKYLFIIILNITLFYNYLIC